MGMGREEQDMENEEQAWASVRKHLNQDQWFCLYPRHRKGTLMELKKVREMVTLAFWTDLFGTHTWGWNCSKIMFREQTGPVSTKSDRLR